jgi:hypothetical protein
VVCSLFASRENGAQIGLSFLRGILLAVPVAFLVGQILLPQWSSFAMLCLGMGVPLFFGALGMAHPRTGATATSYCLHFIVLVAPLNAMHFDVASMLNSALAMLIGERRGIGIPPAGAASPGLAGPALARGHPGRPGAPDPARPARCRQLVWRAHGRPPDATGAACQ